MFEGYGEYNRHLDPDRQRYVTDEDIASRMVEIWHDAPKLGALFNDELAGMSDSQIGEIVAHLNIDPAHSGMLLQSILRDRVEHQARKELTA